MATIDGNGSWVTEDSIAQKRRTASDFWQTPQGGYGSGWGGGLAAALSGLGYGMNLTAADADSRSNQALRSSTMAQAAGAKDNMSMGKILLGAGIPGLDEKGMGTIADARNTADSRSFTEKQAAASRAHSERMLSLQGVQQLSNARAMVPIELDKESRLAQQKSDRDVAAIGGAADTLRTKLPPEVYNKALAAAKAGNRQEALDIILGKDKVKDTFDLGDGQKRFQQVRQPDGSYKVVEVASGGSKQDATTKKAIDEADDFVSQTQTAIGALNEALRLNNDAYDGVAAGGRAAIVNNIPLVNGTGSSSATTQLQNVVTNQALQSLRATFGGNPTEGERKILMDVAGSVNMNRADREKIYARAIIMAQQRLDINRQKAEALRRGTYYAPGGQPPSVDQPVNMTPGGAPPAGSPPVRVTSPDEARKLPSGTRIVLPDGSPGVVP